MEIWNIINCMDFPIAFVMKLTKNMTVPFPLTVLTTAITTEFAKTTSVNATQALVGQIAPSSFKVVARVIARVMEYVKQ